MLNIISGKLFHLILSIIILGYIVFEELVWERFAQPIIRFISQLKLLDKLGQFLLTINSHFVLVLFLIIFIIVELLGIYAASHFLRGQVISGLLIYTVKIPVSGFTYWLFNTTKHKLMKFGWFKRLYEFVISIIDMITHSATYLEIKAKTALIKAYLSEKIRSNKNDILSRKVKTIYQWLRTTIKKLLRWSEN